MCKAANNTARLSAGKDVSSSALLATTESKITPHWMYIALLPLRPGHDFHWSDPQWPTDPSQKFTCCQTGNSAACLLLAHCTMPSTGMRWNIPRVCSSICIGPNFLSAQYAELEQISQTDHLPLKHKRSSQMFEVVQHLLPRRVTMLIFQNTSIVLILWFSARLTVWSACVYAGIPTGVRDSSSKRWRDQLQKWRVRLQHLRGSQRPPLPPLFLQVHYSSCQAAASPLSWLFSVTCDPFWHCAACTKCSIQESRVVMLSMVVTPGKGEQRELLLAMGRKTSKQANKTILKMFCDRWI